MNNDDYIFIKQSIERMFSELNRRMFMRGNGDLISPEYDKLAKAAAWMVKAWDKCFEFYSRTDPAPICQVNQKV